MAQILLYQKKNNSHKGKNTIKIFKLMEFAQAAVRGGAYLRQQELKKLNSKAVSVSYSIVVNKYTF